ncbi:hypothetical protein ABLT89_04920 [Acinetobacter schindleri]|uniref:hypothetical protein n=1 Tax=Acinetobacter schindleri TaxID=108981 RepID=UPI0032B38044
MATDVDVQYFSHLNGLTLGNNWGDLIRLLDKALVTGIDFTEITSASINEQGDVIIDLYAAHNAMLFQVVELSGFNPASLNQKYRIKGVPNTTQLILKPAIDIAERSIIAIGAGKLASLGYDIIFRDANDVKRVYRAKNPTAQHPFIRVDESISSDTGSYTSTYSKYAMVGLLEHMEHIDDYQNPNVLQLPFDPSDPAKNWKITGTGTGVVRGWSRWYWARYWDMNVSGGSGDVDAPLSGTRRFTLVGDADAFYFIRSHLTTSSMKTVSGCGLYDNALPADVIPNWFLSACLGVDSASSNSGFYTRFGTTPCNTGGEITAVANAGAILVPKYSPAVKLSPTAYAHGIAPNYKSGVASSLYDGSIGGVPALSIPIYTPADKILLGTLKHMCYAGASLSSLYTSTPKLAGSSMYVAECSLAGSSNGGFYYYLGELE